MTPINGQFNQAMFMMNALNAFSSANTFSSVATPNIFGSMSFGSFSSNPFGSISTQSVAGNILNNLFSFGVSYNDAPATTSYNFGSFGTNVASSTATTGKAAQAVRLAQSQIGVRENGHSNDSTQVREYKNGSRNSNPWCASFVSWVYGRGQGSNNSKTFGYDASTQSIRAKAMKAGHYSSAKSSYTPQVGDVAIWRYNASSGHTGIVSRVYADGSFDTIEGNCDDKVQTVRRQRNGANFDGFVRMNEWLQA